ncbi:MAG TPA: MFS transporter, partial [Polyangiaceae bacterium]|nr:MFS transporter [Polyangiaceae bacterium]
AVGDVAHPSWRASSVGVYRLWRDLGYAVGALLSGITADALGLPAAMWLVAALTFASGVVIAVRMSETLRGSPDRIRPPAPPPVRGDERATALTARRYDRIAGIYDALEVGMELRARRWRRSLWSRVEQGRVLELGAGTGKNLRHYPAGREVVAMDISERMLARAKRKAERLGISVHHDLGDVQRLKYPDASFDVALATFLFCSVPDPISGLSEIRRVLRPGGQLLLLEHVLSERPLLRRLMGWLDPVPFHLWGAHINRDTVANVRAAGFTHIETVNVALDIVKQISARSP